MIRLRLLSGCLAAAALALASAAVAQQPSGAMQGFSANKDQPVKITANSLEVRDKIRQATFMGDVKLVQGDTNISCKTLVVFYEDAQAAHGNKKAAQAAPAEPPKGGASQQIKRAECKGDVLIVQKDQTASGELGVFDIKTNTMTLTGGVVVTQGQKVMRGDRMVANLTTGVTTVDSPTSGGSKGGGRVEVMLPPSSSSSGPAPAPAAPAPPPAAKAAPKGPIRIN